MTSYKSTKLDKQDDYMTPPSAWVNIAHLIPSGNIIWEAFYDENSKSAETLRELGFNVIFEDIDFFENNKGDIVVSNPPFSKIPKILEKLRELEKPFILIMPTAKLTTQYMRRIFLGEKIQLIIPKKRIHFIKVQNGKPVEGWKDQCYFDCYYYCWKIGLEKDITWLY